MTKSESLTKSHISRVSFCKELLRAVGFDPKGGSRFKKASSVSFLRPVRLSFLRCRHFDRSAFTPYDKLLGHHEQLKLTRLGQLLAISTNVSN